LGTFIHLDVCDGSASWATCLAKDAIRTMSYRS
jgi:hypothetical protein